MEQNNESAVDLTESADPTPEVSGLIRQGSLQEILAEISSDLVTKTEAYSLYVSTDKTPEEIGLQLSLPGFLVRHWVATEKWADLKAKFQIQEYKRAEFELQKFRSDHALQTATRQLSAANKLEDQVSFTLKRIEQDIESRGDDAPLPRDHTIALLRLSQVLKNASDVSARVVGISERPPASESETAKTIIMIGGKPASPSRFEQSHPVIEVQND